MGIINLAWSDAAREASAEARRNRAMDTAKSTKGMKPEEIAARNKLDADTDKAEQEHIASLKGEANYAALSSKEKAQYDEDWKNATAATAATKTSPTVASHEAAASAHSKAAGSAPKGNIQNFHTQQAAVHQNLANAFKPKGSGTGLDKMGSGVASGISEGMYDNLLLKVNRGETHEAGAPSTVLQVAKAVKDRGTTIDRPKMKQIAADVTSVKSKGLKGAEFQKAIGDLVNKHSK